MDEIERRLADHLSRHHQEHTGNHARTQPFRSVQTGDENNIRRALRESRAESQSANNRLPVRPVTPRTVDIAWSVVDEAHPTVTNFKPSFPFDLPLNASGSRKQLFIQLMPSPAPAMKYVLMIDVGPITVTNLSGAKAGVQLLPTIFSVNSQFNAETLTWATRPGTPFSSGYTVASTDQYNRQILGGGGYDSPVSSAARTATSPAALQNGDSISETNVDAGAGCLFLGSPTTAVALAGTLGGWVLSLDYQSYTWTGTQFSKTTSFSGITATMQLRGIYWDAEVTL